MFPNTSPYHLDSRGSGIYGANNGGYYLAQAPGGNPRQARETQKVRHQTMEIKITTPSENTANHGFLAEWGLSILVEVGRMRILVDTGLSFSAVHNA